MEVSTQNREMLRQYLLGQSIDADLSQMDEQLMSDSQLYNELLLLEDELIDEYLRGRMSADDRRSLENYFLRSPRHQQKLRFARALNRYVDAAGPEEDHAVSEDQTVSPVTGTAVPPVANAPSPAIRSKSRSFPFWPFQQPALNYAFGAALLILVAGVSWLAIKTWQPSGPGKVFEATLAPGGVVREGGEVPAISIPAGTDTLRLNLLLPDNDDQDFKVELRGSDSKTIWTKDHLSPITTAGKKSLRIDVSTHLVQRDTYRIKLSSRSSGAYEESASYTFRAAR
jgi:hypothetical protein